MQSNGVRGGSISSSSACSRRPPRSEKLKTSFEPILGPVITKNLKTKNYEAIARQVCQVGFWIVAMQAGIALALGVPGEAVMGLVGPEFVGGTGALAFLLAGS
jgi:hypothetical protein